MSSQIKKKNKGSKKPADFTCNDCKELIEAKDKEINNLRNDLKLYLDTDTSIPLLQSQIEKLENDLLDAKSKNNIKHICTDCISKDVTIKQVKAQCDIEVDKYNHQIEDTRRKLYDALTRIEELNTDIKENYVKKVPDVEVDNDEDIKIEPDSDDEDILSGGKPNINLDNESNLDIVNGSDLTDGTANVDNLDKIIELTNKDTKIKKLIGLVNNLSNKLAIVNNNLEVPKDTESKEDDIDLLQKIEELETENKKLKEIKKCDEEKLNKSFMSIVSSNIVSAVKTIKSTKNSNDAYNLSDDSPVLVGNTPPDNSNEAKTDLDSPVEYKESHYLQQYSEYKEKYELLIKKCEENDNVLKEVQVYIENKTKEIEEYKNKNNKLEKTIEEINEKIESGVLVVNTLNAPLNDNKENENGNETKENNENNENNDIQNQIVIESDSDSDSDSDNEIDNKFDNNTVKQEFNKHKEIRNLVFKSDNDALSKAELIRKIECLDAVCIKLRNKIKLFTTEVEIAINKLKSNHNEQLRLKTEELNIALLKVEELTLNNNDLMKHIPEDGKDNWETSYRELNEEYNKLFNHNVEVENQRQIIFEDLKMLKSENSKLAINESELLYILAELTKK